MTAATPTQTAETEGVGAVMTAAGKTRITSDMTFLHFEVTSPVALRSMADIYELVRINVDDPSEIKFEVLTSEMRIRSGMKIIASAKKPNGNDLWIIQVNHQIRKVLGDEAPSFYF